MHLKQIYFFDILVLQVWAWLRFETFVWLDSIMLHNDGMRENQFVTLQSAKQTVFSNEDTRISFSYGKQSRILCSLVNSITLNTGLCQSSGDQTPAFYCGHTGSVPGQSLWDLWSIQQQWDQFLSLSILFPSISIIPLVPVYLNLAARGHIGKLCMYYIKYKIIWLLGITHFGICPRAACEPTRNKKCALLP